MIRITLLTILISILCVYAWKDWFRTACWLVILMAVFQHPDMPKSIANIPGFNHWNVLFLNVFLSWFLTRKNRHYSWDMPSNINVLLIIYGIVIVTSALRLLMDNSGIQLLADTFGGEAMGKFSMINEYLINCFKWVIPALIIFDGCRSRNQYYYAIAMLAMLFILLALQVIKAMKLGALNLSGETLQHKALKVISNNVGYHRVNISMLMSSSFWALFCLKEYVSKKAFLFIIVPSCSFILLAMVMTGGRMGYATWGLLGIVFVLLKWRKYLLLAPLMVIAIVIIAPSAVERVTQGFTNQDELMAENVEVNFDDEEVDLHSVTSGRVVAWPLVWESIKEGPWLGFGREAMKNLGITQLIMEEHGKGESFPHPHNAYLQWLQDNGVLGAIPVFIFYFLVIKYAWCLFRDNSEKIYVVTGGFCLALTLGFLIAGIGSQTFYPREGAVGMWAGICLMLRVYVERKKQLAGEASELITSSETHNKWIFVKH